MRRSQVAFIRDVWTALTRILVPVVWNTASNEAVKFDPRSWIRNLMSLNRSSRVRARFRGLLHGPLAGGMCGDASEVHPTGAMLDEDQDVQSLQQDRIDMQEVDREDPGGLGVQELLPGRA
jgi:hypothetical protein